MNRQAWTRLSAAYSAYSGDELAQRLESGLRPRPRCPVTRYLLACHNFDRGRPAMAVRHMMVAHHAEPALESAALLVFAGLSWVSRRSTPLLPVLIDTWNEFRRPQFDRFWKERRLLDAFAASDAPALDASPQLAARLWRLPIRALRAQIREAILSRDAGLYPLLSATT